MSKLSETELNKACLLAQTAGDLLEKSQPTHNASGRKLAEQMMAMAQGILYPSITVSFNDLTQAAMTVMWESVEGVPLPCVGEKVSTKPMESITASTEHRVILPGGFMMEINGVPVQLMFDAVIRTHTDNVPLLGLE